MAVGGVRAGPLAPARVLHTWGSMVHVHAILGGPLVGGLILTFAARQKPFLPGLVVV